MSDRLEILRESLIDEHPMLALEVLAQSARLARPLGWHYVLDLIWVLKQLDLPAGATVLDAGAGWGLLQFLLADRGYRVISVDMAARRPPRTVKELYHFKVIGKDEAIEHPYLQHHSAAPCPASAQAGDAPSELLEAPSHAPTLTLYRAELSHLSEIPSFSVDAVVSISALEHNPPPAATAAVRELERVAKPGAPLLLTLSACQEPERFHAPSHSYLLNAAALGRVYDLQSPASDLADYTRALEALSHPRYLERWLSHCYGAKEANNGMPHRIWAPAYLPVGLRKEARKGVGGAVAGAAAS